MFESLEARMLLSASLTRSVLNVTGTSKNDVIVVGRDPADAGKYLVTMNGKSSRFARKSVRFIRVDGGDGNDKITISDKAGTVTGRVTLSGSAGNDTITAGATAANISGGDGNDVLVGGAGSDFIDGGAGDDFVRGGAGNDRITGDDGDDQMYGDAGNDTLLGGAGNDILGGDDEDTLNFVGKTPALDVFGNDSLDGGDGDDWLLGGVATKSIVDKAGTDTMTGGLGNDVIDARGTDTITDQEAGDFVPAKQFKPTGSELTHTHTFLHIMVKGKNGVYQNVLIPSGQPAGIGYFPDGLSSLHTHVDENGKIHFESATTNDSYALIDFFRIWGISFDSHHIGRYVASSKTPITMTVNGQVNTDFGDYRPHDLDQVVIKVG